MLCDEMTVVAKRLNARAVTSGLSSGGAGNAMDFDVKQRC